MLCCSIGLYPICANKDIKYKDNIIGNIYRICIVKVHAYSFLALNVKFTSSAYCLQVANILFNDVLVVANIVVPSA